MSSMGGPASRAGPLACAGSGTDWDTSPRQKKSPRPLFFLEARTRASTPELQRAASAAGDRTDPRGYRSCAGPPHASFLETPLWVVKTRPFSCQREACQLARLRFRIDGPHVCFSSSPKFAGLTGDGSGPPGGAPDPWGAVGALGPQVRHACGSAARDQHRPVVKARCRPRIRHR